MATQALSSKGGRPRRAAQRPGGFLHGLERTATALGHGIAIANAVKGAGNLASTALRSLPAARALGRVAMAALPAIV